MEEKTQFQKFLPYFQDRYDFMLCPTERVEDVVRFIDAYWKKGHAFVKSRKLLDWQHYNPAKDCYNISIAVHRPTGEIHAMVGVTCTSHFDDAISFPVRWGSMLKIRPDVPEPGLGMMVEWYKNEIMPACAEVGFGESPIAIRLAKKTGAHTGVADQYYILNPRKKTFVIADHVREENLHSPEATRSGKRFSPLSEAALESLEGPAADSIPAFKSKRYYGNRFLRHPIYRYHAMQILSPEGDCLGVFFYRICEAEGARCIRIVDYFGVPDALAGCLDCFHNLLEEQDAEYADFLCVGMSESEMAKGGFLERHEQKDVVIPNYFEPFLRENVDVTYSHMGRHDACRIYKGDSDQDRPNVITEDI